jgi:hypothetical protein
MHLEIQGVLVYIQTDMHIFFLESMHFYRSTYCVPDYGKKYNQASKLHRNCIISSVMVSIFDCILVILSKILGFVGQTSKHNKKIGLKLT